MAHPDHVHVAAGGAAEIAQWRDMHPGVVLDLSGAMLSRVRLGPANLSGADLTGACLDEADLRGANLRGAVLRRASLCGADLSDADLNAADLVKAALPGADLSRADFTAADLSDADLSEAIAIDAEFTGSVLARVILTSAHLTRARLIEADLSDAIVENCVVSDTLVQGLRGRPLPPEVLWFDDEPRSLVSDTGVMLLLNDAETPVPPERARTFFLEPQTVELAWERSFSDAAVLAYAAFEAATRATGGWPADVRFLGGAVRQGRMVFLYEAPAVGRIVASLRALLEPFRLAEFVDWEKTASSWARAVGDQVRTDRPGGHAERRRLAALLQPFEDFADNLPVSIHANGQRVAIEFRATPISEPAGLAGGASSGTIEFGDDEVAAPPPGPELVLSIQLTPAGADTAGVCVRFVGAE
ncbi:MAG TPA: pentapeptide repeat-containing protein [Planctomycetaceae bacterium]|nr:pentapeptide repeat-containing protein [Planctomycetaceae bacterium]